MKDITLERQIRNLKDFIAMWLKFNDICHDMEKGAEISKKEE